MSESVFNTRTGRWQSVDESGHFVVDSYPETTKSVFDPTVRMAQDEAARMTCAIFDAIEAERKKRIPTKLIRTDDL